MAPVEEAEAVARILARLDALERRLEALERTANAAATQTALVALAAQAVRRVS